MKLDVTVREKSSVSLLKKAKVQDKDAAEGDWWTRLGVMRPSYYIDPFVTPRVMTVTGTVFCLSSLFMTLLGMMVMQATTLMIGILQIDDNPPTTGPTLVSIWYVATIGFLAWVSLIFSAFFFRRRYNHALASRKMNGEAFFNSNPRAIENMYQWNDNKVRFKFLAKLEKLQARVSSPASLLNVSPIDLSHPPPYIQFGSSISNEAFGIRCAPAMAANSNVERCPSDSHARPTIPRHGPGRSSYPISFESTAIAHQKRSGTTWTNDLR